MKPLSILITSLALCGAGCSDGNLIPVAGVVNFDGQPLTKGTVVFHPDASKGNGSLHLPRGEISPSGSYQLFSAKQKGAEPGWYKVMVVAPGSEKVPTRYKNPDASQLSVEVARDAPAGAYDLNLAN